MAATGRQPKATKALTSAISPAPPDGSKPAMVSTTRDALDSAGMPIRSIPPLQPVRPEWKEQPLAANLETLIQVVSYYFVLFFLRRQERSTKSHEIARTNP